MVADAGCSWTSETPRLEGLDPNKSHSGCACTSVVKSLLLVVPDILLLLLSIDSKREEADMKGFEVDVCWSAKEEERRGRGGVKVMRSSWLTVRVLVACGFAAAGMWGRGGLVAAVEGELLVEEGVIGRGSSWTKDGSFLPYSNPITISSTFCLKM